MGWVKPVHLALPSTVFISLTNLYEQLCARILLSLMLGLRPEAIIFGCSNLKHDIVLCDLLVRKPAGCCFVLDSVLRENSQLI